MTALLEVDFFRFDAAKNVTRLDRSPMRANGIGRHLICTSYCHIQQKSGFIQVAEVVPLEEVTSNNDPLNVIRYFALFLQEKISKMKCFQKRVSERLLNNGILQFKFCSHQDFWLRLLSFVVPASLKLHIVQFLAFHVFYLVQNQWRRFHLQKRFLSCGHYHFLKAFCQFAAVNSVELAGFQEKHWFFLKLIRIQLCNLS